MLLKLPIGKPYRVLPVLCHMVTSSVPDIPGEEFAARLWVQPEQGGAPAIAAAPASGAAAEAGQKTCLFSPGKGASLSVDFGDQKGLLL